ncbi:hypothetical protein Btru_058705 [Bulinus truncatus]|nr:hypothetical protein Btru_058705 [Bulinus truncatus]
MGRKIILCSILLLCVWVQVISTSSILCDQPYRCPNLHCPFGYQTDERNCTICKCVCPLNDCKIICESGFKIDALGCPLCECEKPRCPKFNCSKVCIDGYVEILGCPYCECKVIPCPEFNCEPCPSGHQRNLRGCQTCDCVQICPSYRCRSLCTFPKKNEGFIKACGCKCPT